MQKAKQSVTYAANLNQLLSKRQNLLLIKERVSFNQILQKIAKNQKKDFIVLLKPKLNQMTAVLVSRLMGKNFRWIQAFSNPPRPNLVTRILLNQSDTVLVKSQKIAATLRSQGVEKPKIKIQR